MNKLKIGDRVQIEFEVREGNELYPYYLHPVLEDGSIREESITSLSPDFKYYLGDSIPLKLTIIECSFRVGDRVRCALFGEGVVSGITLGHDFPIAVTFDSGEQEDYTSDGRFITRYNPTLERILTH